MPKPGLSGFTLAELLIALAILGVIATFAIPKILQNAETGKRTAVVKEIFSDISSLTYQTHLSGKYPTDIPSKVDLIKTRFNYVRWCTDMLAEGCRTTEMGIAGWANYRGFVLANGATVGVEPGGYPDGQGIVMILDWNGDAPPNAFNVDEFWVKMNVTPAILPDNTSVAELKPGQTRWGKSFDNTFETLFR